MSVAKTPFAQATGSQPRSVTAGGPDRNEAARCSQPAARERNAEANAWWRQLVRPIFFAMHDRGIAELRIKRVGTKVVFELTPEEPPAENTVITNAAKDSTSKVGDGAAFGG